jgi:site-specific recombinase XerD
MAPNQEAYASDLWALIGSWGRHLRARNLSLRTLDVYVESAEQLALFVGCPTLGLDFDEIQADRNLKADHLERLRAVPVDVTGLGREQLERFVTHLRDTRSAATANVRYRSLQQLFKWLFEEDEIAVNPFDRMRPPKMEEKQTPVVDAADLRRLFKACEGSDIDARRDLALIMLMLDTGCRLAEVAGLRLDDVDFNLGVALVLGKNRRERALPMSPKTLTTVDRYVRARRRSKHTASPWLWLGHRGRLTASGIAQVLRRRSEQAEIERVHPHQLRHTFAHAWLAAGGEPGRLTPVFRRSSSSPTHATVITADKASTLEAFARAEKYSPLG